MVNYKNKNLVSHIINCVIKFIAPNNEEIPLNVMKKLINHS